jgi:glycerol-3-phosphate acyltransferase PlsY
VLGGGGFALVLLLDALKGAAAALAARWAGLDGGWEFAAALAVVAGHVWPVLLGFRGGKGLGPLLGAWLVLAPLAIGACLLIAGAAWGLTRRRVPSGLFGTLLLPVATWFSTHSAPAAALTFVTFGIVALAHRSHFIASPAPTPPSPP